MSWNKHRDRLSHWWKEPTNKVIVHAVGVIFIFSCMWAASYYNTRRLIAADRYVTEGTEFYAHLEGIRSAVANAEQAEHGFLLTGQESFLEQSTEDRQAQQKHIERLRALAGEDLDQKIRLALVARALDRQSDEIAYVVAVRKSRGEEAARQLIGTADESIDQLERFITELEIRQGAILRSRIVEAHRRATSALSGVATLMLVFVVLMLMRLRLTIRDIREKQKIERELRDAQTKLQLALNLEREQARMDSLTQVMNRRAFYEVAAAESARARRYKRPLTIAYLDVDNFKWVNDFCGHGAGDALLITLARILKEKTRSSDIVARIGGDEFAILLPETEVAAADIVLQKLRQSLLNAAREIEWPVTFSIGAVFYKEPPASVDVMVHRADEVMYSIKNGGKDSIAVAASV
jgi:diguanylate cyclase (GGDEF)-like protein